jgi:hypothetical protein
VVVEALRPDAARAGELLAPGWLLAIAAAAGAAPTRGARAWSAGGTVRGPELEEPRTAPLPSGRERGAVVAEPLTVNPLIERPNQKMATSTAIKATMR